jgi:hypothetical protein
MAYSIELADQLAIQLEKFSTSFAHQVAGQFANLAFWIDEVIHAIGVIDGYPKRFAAMNEGQHAWVTNHETMVGSYCRYCGGACELEPALGPPAAPRRIDARQMDAAKQRLKDSAYHLLVRCHRNRLLDKAALIAACDRIGTSVDFADVTE